MTHPDEPGGKPETPREIPTEKHDQGHNLGDPAKMARQQQQGGARNEGEGNRTAARAYNAHVQQSAQNPDETKREAEEAKRAVDGPEGAALKKAEETGRKPARR